MTTIPNFPQSFIDQHATWHHQSHTGAEFLAFHGDFVSQVLTWYQAQGYDMSVVQPWADVPGTLRRDEFGWPDYADDLVLIENIKDFQLPDPLSSFSAKSNFATEEKLGLYIRDGIHDQFLHGATSVAFGEPTFNDFHVNPRFTLFYNLHGMIEEWRQSYLRDAYRCNFSGNHAITIWIEQNAVPPNTVEFRLESAPWITWWKQIIVPDGLGSFFTIETKDSKHEDRVSLWAEQVNNGQTLRFWAGGFFGLGRWIGELGNLSVLPAGSRINFRWVQDWHV